MRRADNLTTFMCRLSWNPGASTSWDPQVLPRPIKGFLYSYLYSQLSETVNKEVECLRPLWNEILPQSLKALCACRRRPHFDTNSIWCPCAFYVILRFYCWCSTVSWNHTRALYWRRITKVVTVYRSQLIMNHVCNHSSQLINQMFNLEGRVC